MRHSQGCEQSCASLIFDRVNDFNRSEVEPDQNVFLDSLVITFQVAQNLVACPVRKLMQD